MGKMKEIAIRLMDLENMLYDNGLHYGPFISESNALIKLGFGDEVQCIIWEYNEFIFNNA